MDKTKRLNVIIPEEDYIALRVALLKMGLTVSDWIRYEVKEVLKKGGEK